MNKKVILLLVATACVALYFYGHYTKDSEYPKYLPVIGGLAFGLNTLIQLAH
jgi:hypothetical protein